MTYDDKKRKKRVMLKMNLEEVSSVDRPAQAPAKSVIMKRAPEEQPAPVMKRLVMTTQTGGHAHTIVCNRPDGGEARTGQTSYSGSESMGLHRAHTHDWVMDDAGNIVIADNDGHTHGVAIVVMKASEDIPEEAALADFLKQGFHAGNMAATSGETENHGMTPEEKAQLEAMQKRAERAEKVAELTDAQRVVYKSLDQEGQERFLSLSPESRQAEVESVAKRATDSNPVIYTNLQGEQFRKSDDPRVVEMAKRLDVSERARLGAEQVAKAERLQKRAGELKHLPNENGALVDLLGAIETLPVEKRAGIGALLNAQNEKMAKAFETNGSSAGPVTGSSAGAQLETIAKNLKTANPKLTDAQAMVAAMKTPEGQRLYAQHAQEVS